MALHVGQEVWKAMKRAEMSREAFASALKISATKVNHIFGNENIDTGLLLRIGEVLHYNFFVGFLQDAAPADGAQLAGYDQKEVAKLKVLLREKNRLIKLQSQTIKSQEDIIAALEKSEGL